MHPLVEEGVEEDLRADDLLAHRGAVVDADACGLDLAFGEGASVVAVGFAPQPLAVVRMHLGAVSDDQLAAGEAGECVEFVEQELSELAALFVVI